MLFFVDSAPETIELKKLLEKVEEMKTQRQFLMDQLREQIHKDDLTRVILSEKNSEPEVSPSNITLKSFV